MFRSKTLPTITYFPLDEQIKFQSASTSLLPHSKQAPQLIKWEIMSVSDKTLYLRQDISAIYENGLFKGVLSKWAENTDAINMSKSIKGQDLNLYQAISYHYGEVHHYNDNVINAIQTMTMDDYFISTENTEIDLAPLKEKTNKQLYDRWQSAMKELEIKQDDYIMLPLVYLTTYNEESLPNLSQAETNKIIGQLWEGLYKNYFVPLTKMTGDAHPMPMILFDKKSTHLIVLFYLDGKLEQLYQQYSL